MSKIVPKEQSIGQTTVEFDINKYPSMSAIFWLRNVLLRRLPLEIVELILDNAEYWPHTTTIKHRLEVVRTPVKWRGTASDIVSKSWPSPESAAMQEVLGFTLYSPPLASEGSFTRATTLKKGLRRLLSKDSQICLPPRGQHPVRMVVIEAVSNHYDTLSGKFCDFGIVRDDEDLREKDLSMTQGQRRNSSAISTFRSTQKSSKSSKSDKRHHMVAQTECWFSPQAKAEGKYVVKLRYDEQLDDEIKRQVDADIMSSTTDFIKKAKVGDSIGLWAPVARGSCVHQLDEVRMHTFWAV